MPTLIRASLLALLLCIEVFHVSARPSRPGSLESAGAFKRATYNSSNKAGLGWTDTSVDVGQFLSKVSW